MIRDGLPGKRYRAAIRAMFLDNAFGQ